MNKAASPLSRYLAGVLTVSAVIALSQLSPYGAVLGIFGVSLIMLRLSYQSA